MLTICSFVYTCVYNHDILQITLEDIPQVAIVADQEYHDSILKTSFCHQSLVGFIAILLETVSFVLSVCMLALLIVSDGI